MLDLDGILQTDSEHIKSPAFNDYKLRLGIRKIMPGLEALQKLLEFFFFNLTLKKSHRKIHKTKP